MRHRNGIKVALTLGVTGIGLLLSSAAAWSDSPDALIKSILAYYQECKPPDSAPTLTAQQCSNEIAEIMSRQSALHLSDAEINGLLQQQGNGTSRRPIPPYPP
jgi:hypothetical protein